MLLAGVSRLQYLEGVPDRQAVELLRYHAGWNFALNRQFGWGAALLAPINLHADLACAFDHATPTAGLQLAVDGAPIQPPIAGVAQLRQAVVTAGRVGRDERVGVTAGGAGDGSRPAAR